MKNTVHRGCGSAVKLMMAITTSHLVLRITHIVGLRAATGRVLRVVLVVLLLLVNS